MFTKEEEKELRLMFWSNFKNYCIKNRNYRKWVLTGVKIKSTQLKFHADNNKALVLFQIDHKNDLRRYEIYETFLPYKKLFMQTNTDLKWDEDYTGIDNRPISAIYFKLDGVNILRKSDWNKIYAFFIEKMIILEDLYWEYKDLIIERIKEIKR